jgi:hypothetical protein
MGTWATPLAAAQTRAASATQSLIPTDRRERLHHDRDRNPGVLRLDAALHQSRQLTLDFPRRHIVRENHRQLRLRVLQLNNHFVDPRQGRLRQLANPPNQLLAQLEWLAHRVAPGVLSAEGGTQPSIQMESRH